MAICARDDLELDRAAADLERYGTRVLARRCDVTRAVEVDRLVEEVTKELGPPDVLVNNAGLIQAGPLSVLDRDDFDAAMDVNFRGTLNATLSVLPDMLERGGGRIVNITSIGGRVPVPHLLPYTCSKFAAVGLSEGLRVELAGTGIRVTTVVPGLMRTGSPPNAWFKGRKEAEFAWFALSDATPLTAMSAERAARRIVSAARRGEAFVTLSWQARLVRAAHDVSPTLFVAAMGIVNRLLPRGDEPGEEGRDGREAVRGMELAHPLVPSPLTTLMNRAARKNNEYGGRPRPSPAHARAAGVVIGPRRTAGEVDPGDAG